MHAGTNYTFKEVIFWTRRDIYFQIVISTIPTCMFVLLDWKWLAIPWLPVALIGTAVAFVIGFKNNASYDRMWEARRIWGAIVNASRSWAILVKDYVGNHPLSKEMKKDDEIFKHQEILIERHFAWLTALRFQLREPRNWEAIYKIHNQEYKNRWFKVDEHEFKLAEAIKPYLSASEYELVMSKSNKAAQIISLQSTYLKELLSLGLIEDFRHMELEKMLVELYTQQGASERIKNFPYPRQYATLNLWFIKIFIILIPLGMLQEFQKLGDNLIWLTIPFSALSGWIFTTMEKIGESSESPFEGSSNDVPITAMSRTIEIDMREIMDMSHDLKPITAKNNILT